MVAGELAFTAEWSPVDSNLDRDSNDIRVERITVNRSRCINPTLVNSFLSMLRHKSDDIIKQRLYAYATFYEDSGIGSNSQKINSNSIREVSCNKFLEKELYPNWKIRNNIIKFCDNEAKKMKEEIDLKNGSGSSAGINTKKVVEATIDPYAARDFQEEEKSKYKELNNLIKWVENNNYIESILQNNTNSILQQNCNEDINYIEKFWTFYNNKR
ncbi:hypothetical protein Kpol_520p16 [Vanderwaltozyma polyspora DSM 70294]|uniref:Uncharacterized protein n=1 Tax=Vanderwaltozyma polyspora (strain ATCC 22028 / DSM 70294 / BCRC 21397 / CBS 2163 / NBRC 10782 / NRRL Y-8283 / UCD 57-17) TaxID=436907 RepID=A7TMA1_VANPO|nr:uncharacterized protein Kpol_520p16 [Vanderwaltozyma polyspora DSM 70294]EDO16595.1 hypothetical protein Kpol_520p16 [Vanderwaltozyma polyspora DSM 70294]